MLPISRWGVQRCALCISDDQKCIAAAKGVVQHGVDDNIFKQTTRSELIESGVSEKRAPDVHQVLHKLSVTNRDLGGAGGR